MNFSITSNLWYIQSNFTHFDGTKFKTVQTFTMNMPYSFLMYWLTPSNQFCLNKLGSCTVHLERNKIGVQLHFAGNVSVNCVLKSPKKINLNVNLVQILKVNLVQITKTSIVHTMCDRCAHGVILVDLAWHVNNWTNSQSQSWNDYLFILLFTETIDYAQLIAMK